MFQSIASIISLIIAPVVLITSCSIFLNGLLTRYAAINDRMRSMARERLEMLLGSGITSAIAVERLAQIDHQLPDLLRRHSLLRNAVVASYVAVLIFIADMVVISVAVFSDSPWIAGSVLVVFLVGILVLFIGALLTTIEVWNSHRAVTYEITRALGLGGHNQADG